MNLERKILLEWILFLPKPHRFMSTSNYIGLQEHSILGDGQFSKNPDTKSDLDHYISGGGAGEG